MTPSRGWSPPVGDPYRLDVRLPLLRFGPHPAGFCLVSRMLDLPEQFETSGLLASLDGGPAGIAGGRHHLFESPPADLAAEVREILLRTGREGRANIHRGNPLSWLRPGLGPLRGMVEHAMRLRPNGQRQEGDGGPEGDAVEADLPTVVAAYAGPVGEGVEAFLSGLTEEGRAAAAAMRDCDAFSWTAFARASEPGDAGERCRALMEACPGFGASVLLDDAGWRAVADGAAPHEALAVLDRRRLGLAYLKGRMTDHRISVEGVRRLAASPGRPATMALAARRSMMAAAMPPHWVPRTPEQDAAFDDVVDIHREAVFGNDYAPLSVDHVDAFLRGCKGDWVAYRERCLSAAAPEHRADLPRLLFEQARETGHFATDVLLPLALAHGDGPILEIASAPPSLNAKPLLMRLGTALLARGLDLPGTIHQFSRHRSARDDIRRVIRAFPRPGAETLYRLGGLVDTIRTASWAAYPRCVVRAGFEMRALPECDVAVRLSADIPEGFVWFGITIRGGSGEPGPGVAEVLSAFCADVGCAPDGLGTHLAHLAGFGGPFPPAARDTRETWCQALYDWTAPQAREAMLRAWSSAMPRRMRRLDGKSLLDVLAPEVEAFAQAHRGELDDARDKTAAMRRHLHHDPFTAMPAPTAPGTDSHGGTPCRLA